MSKAFTNANFPLDPEGRTYHVGTKLGETASRVITVGDPARADLIAALLDASPVPPVFTPSAGTPVSIVAIGMGPSMMDFFVRESVRIMRFHQHQWLRWSNAVTTDGAIMVSRNYDYFTEKTQAQDPPTSSPTLSNPTKTSPTRENQNNLIDSVLAVHPNGSTFEMEAFSLLHLAKCATETAEKAGLTNTVKAASCMMIFADRNKGSFITPETALVAIEL
ncbi:hypothetical protein BC829DRAFT_424434 [Chytridium lagenaria]|nr:hypothetical protein BC829DRAFT_424434 [Chytridium lagenaria]